MSEKETIEVVCEKCGYIWNYSGNLRYTTCPSCQRKTKTNCGAG